MTTLKAWQNGYEVVAAEDQAGAVAVLAEFTTGESDVDEWREVPGDAVIRDGNGETIADLLAKSTEPEWLCSWEAA